jgi:lysophospholipase L1-like esterase
MRILLVMLFAIYGYQSHMDKHMNILVIGDSNGASGTGWVIQLQKLLNHSDILINYSIGGNTIGFDNLDRDTLNTLKNIGNYIKNAEDSVKTLDKILICLGTNDCKAVFDSLQSLVPVNLEKLVQAIRNYPFAAETIPAIVLITPPPIASDSILLPKYFGGRERLEKLLPSYRIVADKYNCLYVDIYHPLVKDFMSFTTDGIHLNETGSATAAEIINEAIKK